MSTDLKLPWTVVVGEPATDLDFAGHTSEVVDSDGASVADFVRDDAAPMLALAPDMLALLRRFRVLVSPGMRRGQFVVQLNEGDFATLAALVIALEEVQLPT